MKIVLSYDELTKVLNFSSIILSDKIVEEKMKNAIFVVTKDSVKIVFYNALTFCRTLIENVQTIEGVDEGEWVFQVKFNELMKVLNGYVGLSKTKVDTLEFSDDVSKVKVSVSEVALKDEDASLNQVSVFRIDNVPLLDSIEKDIKMEFPEGADVVSGADVLLYVDSLFPVMANDTGNAIANKLNFADDYVFVLSSYMTAFFKNRLPEHLKGVTLGYSSVNFLKKMAEMGDISLKRTEKYLCVSVGMSEAFMRFQPIRMRYSQYVGRFSKDNGILLNRLYLKDVLRRMGNMSTDGICKIQGDDLYVENTSFSQVIPIIRSKGEVEGVSFKISVPTIEKLIIGKDSAFPEEIFLYLKKEGSGYALFFADKTGAWFTQTQVR